MKKHVNITIEGRLTERDFNYYCQTGAYKFNIDAVYTNGNERDIYVEAEGEAENIKSYVEFLEFGPVRNSLISFKTEEDELKGIIGFTSYRRHGNPSVKFFKRLSKRFF
jgi:acylphosphatase